MQSLWSQLLSKQDFIFKQRGEEVDIQRGGEEVDIQKGGTFTERR